MALDIPVQRPHNENIVLISGFGHGPEIFDDFKKELEHDGHNVLSPDYPADDPYATLHDYAIEVSSQYYQYVNTLSSESAERDPIVIGWSRGADIAIRTAGMMAVKQVIFIAGALHPATSAALNRPLEGERVPERNTRVFKNSLRHVAPIINSEKQRIGHMVRLNPILTRRSMYRRCDPDKAAEAISMLRVQRRVMVTSDSKAGGEPVLEVWPRVSLGYIACRYDNAVNFAYQNYISPEWLGVEPVYVDTGHAPHVEDPKRLKEAVYEIIY